MVFDVSVAMTWILFLALFPMAFIWLRRTWRILIQKDYSEVALKKGEPPPNPKKWAPVVAILNLTAAVVAVIIIVGVAVGHWHYETWTAMAGSTIWLKLIFDFIISRQAHPFIKSKKKEE